MRVGSLPLLCMMWSMKTVADAKKGRFFDPHETARAQSLAGVPLASFWQRSAAFAIDFLLVLVIYIPAALLRKYLEAEAMHHPPHIAMSFNFHELEDLVWMIVYAGLFVWMTNGLTVGKRLLRIQVVSLKRPRIALAGSGARARLRGLGAGGRLRLHSIFYPS